MIASKLDQAKVSAASHASLVLVCIQRGRSGHLHGGGRNAVGKMLKIQGNASDAECEGGFGTRCYCL